MITNVVISGRLADMVDDTYRNIEVERVSPSSSGKFEKDLFVIRSSRGKGSLLSKIPSGSQVILKARIEKDVKHGVVFVGEVEEVVSITRCK